MTSIPESKFFPDLSPQQQAQLAAMQPLYTEWNARINVLSRKDIGYIHARHILHSLAIAKVVGFLPGSRILDVGTGGGFPGIPLAVLFPEVEFHLVDSIGKKIKVVEHVAEELGLQNVKAENRRAETLCGPYDFVVSRAVCDMTTLYGYVKKLVSARHNHNLKNGIICLKGGDLSEELKPFGGRITSYPISSLYPVTEQEAAANEFLAEVKTFYETKKVIHLAF